MLRFQLPSTLASLCRALTRVLGCIVLAAVGSQAADTKAGRNDNPDLAAAALSSAVELPAFVVTESKNEKPWRFAEGEGFEIISQCDDETTQQVFAALWRGARIALPPELRPNNATPMAVVLFNLPPTKAGTEAMGSSQAAHEVGSHFTNVIKRTLHDREIFSVNLYGRDFRYSSTFRFDLRTHLALHTPVAPPWLVEALHGNYGLYREGIRYQEGDKSTEIVPALWDSAAERHRAVQFADQAADRFATAPAKRTGELAGPSPFAASIPPLAALWNGGLVADNATPPQRTRWAASCALFAHWGIYSENGRRAEAFWRFATRACAEPITEELFRDCFGLSYEEARHEMAWHLPIALREPAFRPLAKVVAPKIKPRAATAAEVARLRGEFARGEALVLAERFPDLATTYRQQATRALESGWKADPTDVRLAATFGLHLQESGDPARARELLQVATAAGQARPRAWYALALMRFNEAIAAPSGAKGQFGPEQATSIFIPLNEALRLTPAMASNYELLAELWRRTRDIPTGETLARLEEGRKAFPRNPKLALSAIRVCIERGERKAAIGFIERSLPFTLDPAVRERLEKTRVALAQSLEVNPGGGK